MNGRRGLVVILLAAIALLASCSTGVGAPPVVTTSTAVATATPPSRATATVTLVPSASSTAPPAASPTAIPPPTAPASTPPAPAAPTAAPVTPTVGTTPAVTPPPSPAPSPTPTLAAGRKRVLAPIDKLEVRLAESQPVQVFVDITSGFPVAARDSTTTRWNAPASPSPSRCGTPCLRRTVRVRRSTGTYRTASRSAPGSRRAHTSSARTTSQQHSPCASRGTWREGLSTNSNPPYNASRRGASDEAPQACLSREGECYASIATRGRSPAT